MPMNFTFKSIINMMHCKEVSYVDAIINCLLNDFILLNNPLLNGK